MSGTTSGRNINISFGESPVSNPPSVNEPLVSPKVGNKFYNVCFQDSLLTTKGWTRPRWEGSKLISLYYNEYTGEMEDGKTIGPAISRYVDRYIDGVHFSIRSGEKAGYNYYIPKGTFKTTIGSIIEPYSASGIPTTLYDVYGSSCFWENEFRTDYNEWERYPPKHASWVYNPHIPNLNGGIGDYVDDTISNPVTYPAGFIIDGIDVSGQEDPLSIKRTATTTTYEEAMFYTGSQYYGKNLHNHAPFAELQNNIPLTPSRFYKINPYTQKEDDTERYGDYHIPRSILLNPIDPDGANLPLTHDGLLGAENVITYVSRSYNYDINNDPILADPFLDTEITRSAIVPRREPVGDISYGNEPVISTYSNAIFVGNSVFGYQENEVFPGPGPDFSYIRLDKAVVFNSDDDSFFVQEIRKQGEDEVFAKLMQSTFPWASEFKIKLLDYDQPNNLEVGYSVHWNKGYFSEVASYTTESSNLPAQGHFPGTGEGFGSDGRFDSVYEATTNPYGKDAIAYQDLIALLRVSNWSRFPIGGEGHLGTYMREDQAAVASRTTGKGGGFYYLPSNTGGGEGSTLNVGFKTAGMGIGKNQTTFPEHPTTAADGNWQTGPGYSSYLGMDPFPGGLRYYNGKFKPIDFPIHGMSQYYDSGGNLSSRHMSGRMISGTFKVNKKNPSISWWFEEGGQENLFWASGSEAGDTTASLKTFMQQTYDMDDLHIITFNEAKQTDKGFKQAYSWHTKDPIKLTPGGDGVPAFEGTIDYVDSNPLLNTVPYLPPGGVSPDDVFLTNPYGNANPGDDSPNHLVFQPYVKPFTTFGSCLFSDYKKVGLKGAHSIPDHNIGFSVYDYSSEATAGTKEIAEVENGNLSYVWDIAVDGVKPKQIISGSGPVGGISLYGINAPRFMNGSPYLGIGDAYNYYDAATKSANIAPGGIYESISVWTNYWYGFNWTSWIEPGEGKVLNYQKKKKWPSLDKWTISKLDNRPNFILTDLNKQEHLPDGEGTKGFILIPDNLNPRIKANLDYYLGRAGLINKEKSPKYKDKTIKKGSYLPSKIIKKVKKRKWWDVGRRKK